MPLLTMLNRIHAQRWVQRTCVWPAASAYNCVVNGKIFAKTPFEKVYIQSAAGDAGLAIGAAFYVWHQIFGRPRSFEMKHAYWGPEFDDDVIGKALRAKGIEQGAGNSEPEIGDQKLEVRSQTATVAGHPSSVTVVELQEEELVKATARQIAEGKVVGWFQGRMELGPRALRQSKHRRRSAPS